MRRSEKIADNYASPAMQARRERILDETLNLIAEQGMAGFSLLELCRRADVAKQTLYYAFGSREGLIAAAIRDFFEKSESRIPYHSPPGSLERILERVVAIGQRNLGIRNYVAAIVSFYYGGSTSPELWRTIHDITLFPLRPYVEGLRRARQLQPWMSAQQLLDGMDAERLNVSNEWVQGRISDEEMIDRMVINMLTFLLGAVRGGARTHVERTLRDLTRVGAVAYVESLGAALRANPAT
jgi:AcrR family transcriptional regulator